jgi:hypothetical protein
MLLLLRACVRVHASLDASNLKPAENAIARAPGVV